MWHVLKRHELYQTYIRILKILLVRLFILFLTAAGAHTNASGRVHQHCTGAPLAHMQGPVVHPVAYPKEAGFAGRR